MHEKGGEKVGVSHEAIGSEGGWKGVGESRSVARSDRERRRLEEVEMRKVLSQQTLEVGIWW
jgi:hypothetical protein